MEKHQYGHEVTVTAPTPYELSIEFNVILDTGYTVAGVQTNIENAIKDYVKSVQREWFTEDEITIYISRLMVAILSVEGVINASSLTINGSTEDLTINPIDENNPYPVLKEVIINES